MQLFVYCFLALLALGVAKPNPQIFGKRFLNRGLILYLTPEEIKSLQAVQESQNPGPQNENLKQDVQVNRVNEALQKYYSQRTRPTPSNEQQIKNIVSQGVYLQQEKDVNENLQNKNIAYMYFVNEKDESRSDNQQAQNVQQEADKVESLIKTNSNAVPYVPVSYKNQEEKLLHEQLIQHWNRLLEHNRAQLQVLSSAAKEQSATENEKNVVRVSEQQQIPSEQSQNVTNTEIQQAPRAEVEKTEVEKEIENILRSHQAFQPEKFNPRGTQNLPILIHRQVSITKHQPIPIYKQVKVQVPTPVLVPVPEPYAVRVPQPYPVPLEVVKHIPVPVVKN